MARWAELGVNDPLPILLRSAGGQPTAASALADFLTEKAIGPMITQLLAYGMSREDAAERAAAFHALVVGVVFIRRVLHSSTLATISARTSSAIITPFVSPPGLVGQPCRHLRLSNHNRFPQLHSEHVSGLRRRSLLAAGLCGWKVTIRVTEISISKLQDH